MHFFLSQVLCIQILYIQYWQTGLDRLEINFGGSKTCVVWKETLDRLELIILVSKQWFVDMKSNLILLSALDVHDTALQIHLAT